MVDKASDYNTRIIVTGEREDGKATFIADGEIGARTVLEVCTIVDFFQPTSLPTPISEAGMPEVVELQPNPGGLMARMVCFPPDSEWKGKASFSESLGKIEKGHEKSTDGDASSGMHKTETVDLIICVEGELWSLMDDGSEKLLKPGDVLMQRGTNHAWSNRTDKPAVIAAILMGGSR